MRTLLKGVRDANHQQAPPAKMLQPPPVPSEVPAVFLDPTADLLLKSSDGVLFRVHKAIVSVASTVWRNLLQDARPESPSGTAAGTEEEPIGWPESAQTIIDLLYRMYPIPKPDLPGLERMFAMAVAADKWGMDWVLEWVQAELLRPENFCQRPLGIHNLACNLRLTEFQKQAARQLVELHDPNDDCLSADLHGLTAWMFVNLCKLRRERIDFCLAAVDELFPTFCPCGSLIRYNGEKTGLKKELSAHPGPHALPVLSPLVDLRLEAEFNCAIGSEFCPDAPEWLQTQFHTLRGMLEEWNM